MRFWRTVLAIFLISILSCAKPITMSSVDINRLEQGQHEIYVKTKSGDLLRAKFYSVSGDTLILTEPDQLFYEGFVHKISIDEIDEIKNPMSKRLTLLGKLGVGLFAFSVSSILGFAIYLNTLDGPIM